MPLRAADRVATAIWENFVAPAGLGGPRRELDLGALRSGPDAVPAIVSTLLKRGAL